MQSLRYFLFFILIFSFGMGLAQDVTPPTEKGIPPEDFHRIAQSGWQYLKITANARHAAMAGIKAGLGGGGSNAIFGNPAEMVSVQNIDVGLNRVNWFADIAHQSFAASKRFSGIGVIGISLLAVDYGDFKRTEYLTIDDPAAPTGQRNVVDADLGTFTASDMAIGISYAREVTDRLQIGANIRYLRMEIDTDDMSNYSIDIGTLYYTGFKTLRIAMVARNFGPDQKLVDYNEEIRREPASIKMPAQFRLGVAMDILEGENSPHKLTAAVEGVHPNDGPEKLNVGVEYTVMNMIMARGGYRFNYDEEGLTLGAGLNLSFGKSSLLIDYAYVDFGNLDNVQMFSLGLTF